MKVYHVSNFSGDELDLSPRIPNNFMTENNFEDSKTPRVCVSNNINGALRAMSANLKGKDFRVFSADIPDEDIYKPNDREVPDAHITGEHWVKKPLKMNFDRDIAIGESIGDGFDYTYGDGNTATLYDWDFSEKKASVKITKEVAIEQLKKLGKDVKSLPYTIDDFTYGMNVELEHGTKLGKDTNVTDNNPLKTAKITLAHMKESPLYYQELKKMESKLENKKKIEKTAKLNDDVQFNRVQQRALDNPSNNMILAHAVGSGII